MEHLPPLGPAEPDPKRADADPDHSHGHGHSHGRRISYPEGLPISARRGEIIDAIRDHQVVVVAGETGSGKSTQLPKMCLDAGRGETGMIAHTQPRRIAARSIAERVADELEARVGGLVGYQVRFTDEVGPDTRIKLMTDGIMLAEIQRDPELRRYDTIIIDEAHERSLNIDFLLGWLGEVLARRPDLRLIITSATIDTEKFARHFGDAPVIEVSGRSYPVEVRYRPITEGDQTDAICAAVAELWREPDGDVLVFCSGEREIRDASEAISALDLGAQRPEVVPLYGRLSAAEQHKVFARGRRRRVVVATNVAETSLTVPGIRFVVDTGLARISRFNRRTKVQRLPIEAISQASANQRAGRCGRVGPGVCVRLYSEDDFDSRPEFTDPEIQRTSLASVILQMASLGLGDVAQFSFVDPPDSAAIRDGIALLEELGAVRPGRQGHKNWLTRTGRQLARLPLDPRLARMLLEAHRLGCLVEVRVIVAALSLQDVRERPLGQEAEADTSHRRFAEPDSDLLSWLGLWEYLSGERRERSSSDFRRLCRREFFHHLRVREWQDLHGQLARVTRSLGWPENEAAASGDLVHRALLAGLLSHIGVSDSERRLYRGPRGTTLTIAPGSNLHRQRPRWIMAAELVETNRLWARQVARIRPEWVEHAGREVAKHTLGERWWDEVDGAAKVRHSVSVYGLPVVSNRTELLHRHDREDARHLLIEHALLAGQWGERRAFTHPFVEANQATLEEVDAREIRERRDDLRVSHSDLVAFFDRRLPEDVATVREFDQWWKSVRSNEPDRFVLKLSDVIRADDHDERAFPPVWTTGVGEAELPLTYVYEPGHDWDGLVVDVPIESLRQLDPRPFDWLVPGRRVELLEALLRTLPKAARKALFPIADSAAETAADIDPDAEADLLVAVADSANRRFGLAIEPSDFDLAAVPSHLRPTFRVLDEAGEAMAEGRDITALRAHFDAEVRDSLAGDHELTTSGLTAWPTEAIPTVTVVGHGGHEVQAFPALCDDLDGTVSIRLFPDQAEAAEAHWGGVRRLLALRRPSVSSLLRATLDNEMKLALVLSPYSSPRAWLDDCVDGATEAALVEWVNAGHDLARTPAQFEALEEALRPEMANRIADVARASVPVLVAHRRLVSQLEATPDGFAAARRDVDRQRQRLVHPTMLTEVELGRLPDIARYLDAATYRLSRVGEAPQRDLEHLTQIAELEQRWEDLCELDGQGAPEPAVLETVGWDLQELRVGLFAQHLGTSERVSVKKLRRRLDRIERSSR